MGFLGFGKKKDSLDDLKLPGEHEVSQGQQPDAFSSSQQQDPFASDDFTQQQPADQDPFAPGGFPQQQGMKQSFESQSPHNVPHSFDNVQSLTPSQPLRDQQSLPSDKSHEFELLLSKMEVLKSMVENLEHRMSTIESKIEQDIEQRKKSW